LRLVRIRLYGDLLKTQTRQPMKQIEVLDYRLALRKYFIKNIWETLRLFSRKVYFMSYVWDSLLKV